MRSAITERQSEALLARWQQICREVAPYHARLIAVSKYAPDAAVAALIAAGQRDFGESRPQQLRDRALRWPQCNWHMIGPLQRNKAKYIGRFAASWMSLESWSQAEAVARQTSGRILSVLIQVNVVAQAQQHGVDAEDLSPLFQSLQQLNSLRVTGLMAMVPRGNDAPKQFVHLRRLKEALVEASLADLCMGMSHDYQDALAAGATMVRIGSRLFGELDVRHPV
ncbi:MAG: YggS family pyridoxal phosphate-dependent enzyme [Mariprofundales bacterium]|nr:YggS family pyridoxal phosphate-dependent enzyme [Mariprofundales bacterium]